MNDPKPAKPQPEPRSSYRAFRTISTRWMDNDAYGHVNNVVYYSWFDTVVNEYLIAQGVLDVTGGAVIGLVVGIVSSMLGVAGGELLIPTLVFVFGADIRVAGTASLRLDLIFG